MTGPNRRAMPVVDSHQHLWDLNKFKLPWLAADSKLNQCFLPGDYGRESKGLNVIQTVYMEVDVDEAQQAEEARWILELCERDKTRPAAAVISGRPASEGFGKYLDEFKGRKPLKGVRQVLHVPATPPGYCLGKAFVAGLRVLGERGLSFDLCIKPGELPNIAKLLDECKGTQFVLDHCGNPSLKMTAPELATWRADLACVAEKTNVVCKVSGFIATAEPGWEVEQVAPIVDHVLGAFGPDRVLFGGDWPVCTLGASLREWVKALEEVVAGRPEEERYKLWCGNAGRVYRLGLD